MTISNQCKWQLEKKAQGLCISCGKNPIVKNNRNHCLTCRDKSSTWRKKYYLKNREKILIYQKEWSAKNKEKINKYQREYYQKYCKADRSQPSANMVKEI